MTVEALTQLCLGFAIGFTGAAIPGPLTTLVVANGLSGKGRFHGVLSAVGHCVVEASIIAAIALGLVTVLDVIPLRLLNAIGGSALSIVGIVAIIRRTARSETVGVGNGRNALLAGMTLSTFNGTILLWWMTVGLQQLSYAMNNAAAIGGALWVMGHWSADITWYGFLGYSSYRGRSALHEGAMKRVTVACSVAMILIGGLFILLAISS